MTREELGDIYQKLCKDGGAELPDKDGKFWLPLRCHHLLPLHDCKDPKCVAAYRLLISEAETTP